MSVPLKSEPLRIPSPIQKALAAQIQYDVFAEVGNHLKISEATTGLISGATAADPVVITSTSHGLNNGQRVVLYNLGGMTELNNKAFTVANTTANTFELQDEHGNLDGTGFTAYTSGGIWKLLQRITSATATHKPPTGDVAASPVVGTIDHTNTGDLIPVSVPTYDPGNTVGVDNEVEIECTYADPTEVIPWRVVAKVPY